MSRRYEIEITDIEGKPVSVEGLQAGPWDSGKMNNPLDIEFDIQTTGGAVIASQTSTLVIRGLPMSFIRQSVNFGGCLCTIKAGFSNIGLPLATVQSVHYNMILQGQIYVPYANWQGVNQSLNLGLINYSPVLQPNDAIQLNGEKGEKLHDVILRGLEGAFQGRRIQMSVVGDLVLPEAVSSVPFLTLGGYSAKINQLSRAIAGRDDYSGIDIFVQKDFITVTDFVHPMSGTDQVITLEELIGQPTWDSWSEISVKVPLRADLNVGDALTISGPGQRAIYTPYGGAGAVLTTNGAVGQIVHAKGVTFSGEFIIRSVRHVGAFRNPSPDSWVTIITAVARMIAPEGAG